MDTSSIETDWRRWVKTMFPHHTSKEFAWFHEEVWKWIWDIQPDIKPEPLVDIIFRAGAKSSTAEMGCPAVAARSKRNYAFYVSGTQDQADDHVTSVAALLEDSKLHKYYPSLAQPKVGKHGERRGWRRNRLWTAGGFIIDAAGLDSAVRGAKLGTQRPDIITLDDIDSKKDSLDVTAKSRHILVDQEIQPLLSSDGNNFDCRD